MMKLIKGLLLSLLLILTAASLTAGSAWVKKSVKDQAVVYNSRLDPTIMIPGSSASNTRFDNLIAILNSKSTPHSVLRIRVNTNDTINYSGRIKANDMQPYIVIAFQDNRDGYDTIKHQARWLNIAMKALQRRYHFNHFNAFGHSNGGLDWTIYLENYFNSRRNSVGTLMTVGSPYNFSESSPNDRTQMLTDLIKKRQQLPSSLLVYSIAGTETYKDDGIVPIESVLSGRYIFQKVVRSYTQVTVSGSDSQHADLPTNPQIVDLIQRKMLNFPNSQLSDANNNGNN